jgi:hypothetical protein
MTIAALAAASCIWAGGASAATEVGNECAATNLLPAFSFVQIGAEPGGLPVTIPAAGVITRWRINAANFAKAEAEYLKVMRPAAGGPNTYAAVGESQAGLVTHPGPNSFAARISVQAGDHLGVFGTPGAYFCFTGKTGDANGAAEGNLTIGARDEFSPNIGGQLALAATVEPDADNDGYGDETQDLCPQSPTLQEACPPLTLSAYAIAGRRAVRVLVTAGVAARVKVSGSVKLPRGRRRARRSSRATLAGVAHLANPGQITAYRLKFPKRLRSALKKLPKRRSLKLALTAEGTNLAGVPKVVRLGVRLRGWR